MMQLMGISSTGENVLDKIDECDGGQRAMIEIDDENALAIAGQDEHNCLPDGMRGMGEFHHLMQDDLLQRKGG